MKSKIDLKSILKTCASSIPAPGREVKFTVAVPNSASDGASVADDVSDNASAAVGGSVSALSSVEFVNI